MKTYLVHLTGKREVSDEMMKAHWGFFYELTQKGPLKMAGPYTNFHGGAYVFEANTLEEAEALAKNDPLVLNDLASISIFEWHLKIG
ncbi:YciI family protein [Pseudomonas sp. MWU15-20650]|uniref:YciI family protein n=1 Tax=Pseudomonas sp. MWU15-20650 TaxID=2933107 RepID=UPI00200BFD4F|nr:YciI family protein [Pseudomonas sp. MWU15-20650]